MSTRTLPAEWAPQSGVQLTWPHPATDWAPRLTQVEPLFVQLACTIARFEPVLIVCNDAMHREHITRQLRAAACPLTVVRFAIAPSNDTWARDHGVITLLEDGKPQLLDFRFNGWGGKYAAELDNQINSCLQQQQVFGANPLHTLEFVLEGGSLDSDGQGSLLTTTACLLTPTRNPAHDRAGVESVLRETLGVQRVLWLEHGYLAGDDTDSHIDMLARFCSPDTIAYVHCDRPEDEHYAELQAMQAELQALRQANGKAYRLVPLPLPLPIHTADGERLPASYANFLIINGAVLVPVYDDPQHDAQALQQLAGCFPDREIVTLPCRPIIVQHGSLHCLTMQFPAGVLN